MGLKTNAERMTEEKAETIQLKRDKNLFSTVVTELMELSLTFIWSLKKRKQ